MSDYVTSQSRSSYYSADSRVPSRLWAAEKALHDLAEIGLIEFFEGPGPNPTIHTDYASDKIWLRQNPGVQPEQGEFRVWSGDSPVQSEASWVALTARRFFEIVTGGVTTTVFPMATQAQAAAGALQNVLMDPLRTRQAVDAQIITKLYPTLAAAAAATIPATTDIVRILTGATLSDGYSEEYGRAASEPSHSQKFQSFDGQWWENTTRRKVVATACLGDAGAKINAGTAINIAWEGDSIPYGQFDPGGVSSGGLNGSANLRSTTPAPESLATALGFCSVTATVINRGYPGDSTVQGLTRWAGASATDFTILMYGHNDANNYGGNGVVSVAQYRANLTTMAIRRILQGSTVIIVAPPPVNDRVGDLKLRAYVSAARDVARKLGLPFVDAAAQLSSLYDKQLNLTGLLWNDGTHLSNAGYRELGWHLAALITGRSEELPRVGPGSTLYMNNRVGFQPNSYFTFAASRGGVVSPLTTGQTVGVGVYVEAPCLMVVTTVNTSGGVTQRPIEVYYAGASNSEMVTIQNSGSPYFRSREAVHKLYPGYRYVVLRNAAAADAYIERIDFVSCDDWLQTTNGLYTQSRLAGCTVPINVGSGWYVTDRSQRVGAPSTVVLDITLPHDKVAGITITPSMSAASNLGPSNQLMIIRDGTALKVREKVNGTDTDTTFAAAFTGGADWTGKLELRFSQTVLEIWREDISTTSATVTKTFPYFYEGYLGLISYGTSRLKVSSAMVTQVGGETL